MAQCRKSLHKHEDLSSDPQKTPADCDGLCLQPLLVLGVGGVEKGWTLPLADHSWVSVLWGSEYKVKMIPNIGL